MHIPSLTFFTLNFAQEQMTKHIVLLIYIVRQLLTPLKVLNYKKISHKQQNQILCLHRLQKMDLPLIPPATKTKIFVISALQSCADVVIRSMHSSNWAVELRHSLEFPPIHPPSPTASRVQLSVITFHPTVFYSVK